MRLLTTLLAALALLAAPVAEARLTLKGVGSLGMVPPEDFSITYNGGSGRGTDAANVSNGGAYTFAGLSVGADATGSDTRYTIVSMQGQRPTGVTTAFASVTICGQSATVVQSAGNNVGPTTHIAWANTTGQGTTCTVTVTSAVGTTADTQYLGLAVATYRMVNPGSGTPTDSGCGQITSTAITRNTTISTGGAAVANYATINATGVTVTWTNASGDLNTTFVPDSTVRIQSATSTTAGSPTAITGTSTNTSVKRMCTASWAP